MSDQRARARERTCAAAGHHVWGAGREPCMVCGAQRCVLGSHAGPIERFWRDADDASSTFQASCDDCGREQAVRLTDKRLYALRRRSTIAELPAMVAEDLEAGLEVLGHELTNREDVLRWLVSGVEAAHRG